MEWAILGGLIVGVWALLREIGDEGMCPSCRRFVERAWRICPFCATQLKDVCAKCEQLLSFNWVTCPFCATTRRGYGTTAAPKAASPTTRSRSATSATTASRGAATATIDPE